MRCTWYNVCPLRRLEHEGILGDEWREYYCKGHYRECERYRKEEQGIPHSDTLLPDGTYVDPGR